MAILIIGGTGFIGARIADGLVKRGEEVVCFDLYPDGAKIEHLGDKAKIVIGDVTRIDDLLDAIKNYKIDKIISLAALMVAESEKYLFRALRLNFMGMVNVFEAARILEVKKVVYASSIAAYGIQSFFGERDIEEKDICQPILAYGAHKVWTEFMAKKYTEHHRMNIAGLRIAIVSGPGRKTGISAWSSTYIDNPAMGKPVEIPYRGDQTVLITYVDQAAETFIKLCCTDNLNHQIYNSFGYSISIKELADIVKKFLPEAKITFNDKAEDMPLVYKWSCSKIEKEFGWTAPAIEEMVKQHINEVRRNAGIEEI